MSYTFQFGVIAQYQDALLAGIWLTIKLSMMSIILGCAGGILFASLRSMNSGIIRFLIDAYVEIIRNTPFLVQLFIIYFGLPAVGFRVGAEVAALIGMTINLTAYSTEIIRSGIEAVHRSQTKLAKRSALHGCRFIAMSLFYRPWQRSIRLFVVSSFL